MKKRNLLLPSITLLGFALRVYNLTFHSLWFDEAISLRWARSTVPRIWDVSMHLVEDRLPPLYYLLLKWWGDVAGLSEFSVRYLSVIFGVLLIPVVFALGRRFFNRATGMAAALLVALNPFLIWYSQEARMYAPAVLFGALGVLCFVRAVEAEGRPAGWWIGLGVCALAGLYTHLYTGFLWPALAIWLVAQPRLFKRDWLPFGLTMGAVSALFAPLALANWRFSGESHPGDPLAGVGQRAIDLFRAFSIWQARLPDQTDLVLTFVLGIVLLFGLMIALRNRWGRLAILLLLMPFVIAGVLMLRSDLAFFGHRYFIVMVPWLLLSQAAGVGWLISRPAIRWAGWGLAAIVAIATVWPVSAQWTPGAAKEGWRQTVAYLTDHVQPDEAIFIHPEWIRFPYQYYEAQMNTPGQTYAAFFAVDAQTDLDGPLNGILGEHPVVWLVQSHIDEPDPDRRVENWFAARFPLVTELYPPGITLKAYAPGYRLNHLPPEAVSIEAELEAGLTLVGFELVDTQLAASDAYFHPPSNWIHVTLYFSAGEGAVDASPLVRLVDDLGQVWGASLERGNDSFDFYPPSKWEPGQVIRLDVDVNLNPATSPGSYHLVAGIGEQTVPLSMVEITPGN